MLLFRAFSFWLLLSALVAPSLASRHQKAPAGRRELSNETLNLVEDRLAETAIDT